jgi:hypothetical protein
MDTGSFRRGTALFLLVTIGLLVLFTLESAWWALALGGVVALLTVLGLGLRGASGDDRVHLRDLRLFLRAESWGLGPNVPSQPLSLWEVLAATGLVLVTVFLFVVAFFVDR